MQNNRMLHISTAGSRKAIQWPGSTIMWSEFTEKLSTPVRGDETLEQYLAFPKAQQDELKDIGGFVGGTLRENRRKQDHVEGRDLLTLDLDNIPAGQTDDILRRVGGLGCAAAVYSTRKHSGYAPRLRVIVPVDRTATADEYEPAARKLASLIGIEFCDPTTFEPHRLMYWPSCCCDSQYVYQVYDKPFCSLDGLLGMYGDWKDVTQWPQVPGAEAMERRRLAKQEDPTTKRGIIGAFCRTYGIVEAMERFIPGMYEETATTGRYTYTGGETTGGAIVYDGGLFLYSHHSHDPCCGQLVNAFDLVRLHMYGDKDAAAKEDFNPQGPCGPRRLSNKWSEESRTRKAAQGKTANLALGTPAAQKSPKSGKFLTNINAKDWHLISPDGKEYKFHSLNYWLRENGDKLFGCAPDSKEFKNVSTGLSGAKRAMLGRNYGCCTYKGWKVIPTEHDIKK